ncbi:MAG: riboflavin synthase [Actinomycetes bacterium]
MFTGIVREVGHVVGLVGANDGMRIEVEAPETAPLTALGDSVSINGCCLTVVAVGAGRFAFEAVPETLAKTSLDRLAAGSRVNVEPALRAGEPLGGHYVQGHVDGIGSVRSVVPEGDGRRLTVDAPDEILRYVVSKGSIAVEGTSLTVAAVDESGFALALIPHTISATTLGDLKAGDTVNLEADVLAKYVERLLPGR